MCFIQLVGSELIIPPNYEKFYRHVQCGRITLPQKYSMTGFVISLNALFQAVLGRRKSPPQFYWNYGGLMVGESGFEPLKSVTTDLQSVPFGRSGTLPYLLVYCLRNAIYQLLELVNGLEPLTC